MARFSSDTIRAHVGEAPVLADPTFSSLRPLQGRALPEQQVHAVHHANLACVLSAFLAASLDWSVRPKPRRKADTPSLLVDFNLIAFVSAVESIARSTGEDRLLSGPNGAYVMTTLRARRWELAGPLETYLAGGDALQVGAQVASLAVEAVERNQFKSKVEPFHLTLLLPTAHRMALELAEEHLELEWAELLSPLTGQA